MRAVKLLVPIAALCLGLAVAWPASAATAGNESWYAVEILVFRYTGPNAAQGETWPPTVPAPSLENAIYPPAAGTAQYRPLRELSTVMVQAQRRLAATNGYEPLEQTGWMQPGKDPDSTRPVSLDPITPAAAASAPGEVKSTVQVQGTATLAISANKPYVQLDLRLCEPPPPGIEVQAPTLDTASTPATAGSTAVSMALPAPAAASAVIPSVSRQCFALKESHQVTLGQMEYFDTAAFGVLALVRQVAPPAETAVPSKTNTGPTSKSSSQTPAVRPGS